VDSIYYGGDGRVYNPSVLRYAGGVCPGIIAAYNPTANVKSRFCGNHNFQIILCILLIRLLPSYLLIGMDWEITLNKLLASGKSFLLTLLIVLRQYSS